ncbi:hypothetical protein M427DRAFT_288565 [Gonapodya prolifera JEL478]|uniref:Uncharacterized protein n=1 Tax=Gonapodya prolifera (strain JEL478) TaxID=1344416 RepID=A0A139AJQ0_GONPJ|nr:hypothetical protein M427DRAFT_288565 [Gonapodya prolifera JEL478]|eukprot:KXS16625.1 hypothetical protein M427DRAFT_288565 [Gonapodya prolifera JEL478]
MVLFFQTVTSNRSQLLASGFFLIISIVYAVTHTFQQRSFLWQITEFIPDYNFGGGRDRAASALSYTLVAADITFGVVWAFLGPGVWAGMRWKLYKDEGADTITRLRTFRHHVFQLVLKLALFFHISVTIQFYFLVLGGLGWSIFANFILAFDGMMLALGFYTISVIGGGAVAERSPSTMSLFVIGCMAEIVFLLEFCISVLRNKVAGSYPLDAAGSVYTLALSALLTVLTLLVAGIIAAMNAREYMSIWDLPRRQRSRSGHERLTSQITVVEPPAIEVTRSQTASTLTDDILSDRPEDREDSLARYGTSAGTRTRPGSTPARMGGGLRVEREELGDDRDDSLARYGTSPARVGGVVRNEREVELVDDREDSLARYRPSLGTGTIARPRSVSRPPVAPGAEI